MKFGDLRKVLKSGMLSIVAKDESRIYFLHYDKHEGEAEKYILEWCNIKIRDYEQIYFGKINKLNADNYTILKIKPNDYYNVDCYIKEVDEFKEKCKILIDEFLKKEK